MADFFVPEIDPKNPQRHLRVLQTEFGVRSVYDSVSFCNRCGSCQQVCPTYALTGEEPFSPRGRNQAVRLAAEGKLKIAANRARLEQLVNTCLLCGRCTQACAGKIPTAQHMLELRRALKNTVLPGLLQKLLGWRSRRPGLFRAVVRAGLCLRRMGLLRLFRGCGLTRLAALQWLEHADDILPRRINSSDKTFWRQALQESPKEPSLIYLPSLEAAFFMPSLAARVLKKAQQKYQVQVWEQVSSGLFEYVYGDLRQSRRLVRRLIRRCARTGTGSLPLLTDSIDVYLFWRRAPQLFDRWPRLLQHLYTLFLVVVSWAIFAVEDFTQLGGYLRAMFGMAQGGLVDSNAVYYLTSFLPILVIAAVAATPLAVKVWRGGEVRSFRVLRVALPVLLLVGLIFSTAYLVDASYNPFLYFRF